MIRAATAAMLLATAVGGVAAAQYREGQPAVMPAPRPADPNASANIARAAFARWNAAHGQPSVLVFWNRALTDQTTTVATRTFREVEETTTGSTKTAEVTNTQFGQASNENVDGLTRRELTRETGARVETGGQYAPLSRAASNLFESGFVSGLIGAGGNLVDRDTLIRKLSLTTTGKDQDDLQRLESLAIDSGVQYLIEVLPDKNANSPTGMTFTVKIKHLPTSTLRGQFQTAAAPPAGPSRMVVGPNGYERQTVSLMSPNNVAAQLAVETLGRLAGTP